jgi:hypothetical protein
MSSEIGERSLGQCVSSLRVLLGVENDVAGTVFEDGVLVVGDHSVGVIGTPLDIGFDIDSVSGSLGDGQSEVESDEGGNTSDTDDSSPSLVDTLEMVERFAEDL